MDVPTAFLIQPRRVPWAVAELMGVDRAHISSMERGQQNVTLLTLWHAAQALGVKPVDLLSEDFASGDGNNTVEPSS